jgi:quinoprotein dehydrogenase-associated probable ABC transporter substrate-binding protein
MRSRIGRGVVACGWIAVACTVISAVAQPAPPPPEEGRSGAQTPPSEDGRAGTPTPQTLSKDALLPGKTAQAGGTLRVCADPHGLPQSNDRGEGYENKIAEALAHDLGKKVEYTYFPQRMGFVRNTLKAHDDQTLQFKCDVIIGVPKGYDLTATTQPYMHSIYALVLPPRADFKDLKSAEDLLTLPPAKLHSLRIGLFAQTPASDWVLQNGLIDRAVMYPAQSGDPNETPDTIVERDLAAGKIDVAVVWGPVAGFVVSRHSGDKAWVALPFKPNPNIRFDYEIAMGVRQGEKEWQSTLDGWIGGHRTEITQILTAYHIPLIEEPAAAPRG